MINIFKNSLVFAALSVSASAIGQVGGPGGVDLTGSSADDTVYTIPGGSLGTSTPYDDRIEGKGGRDIFYAGDGHDSLFGGDGNDHLVGGFGDDIIYGNKDRDTIYGNDGNDFLKGGRGDDLVKGGNGDDIIYGGPGNDTLYGGNGNDVIYPGPGQDVVIYGNGINTAIVPIRSTAIITSGEGNDTLIIVGDEPSSKGTGIILDDAGGVMTVIFESLYIEDVVIETTAGSTFFKDLNGQTILTYTTPKIVTMTSDDLNGFDEDDSKGGLKVIFASD